MSHLLTVSGNTNYTVVMEGLQAISQQASRLQEVVDQNGHEYVQLKVTLRSSHTNSYIIGNNLNSNHGHGFALSGVNLTGHDGATGLVFRNEDLTQTAARTAGQPANVVSDLHQVSSQSLQSTMSKYQVILRSQSMEFVFSSHIFFTGQNANFLSNFFGKSFRSIQAGTNRSTTQSQFFQTGQRFFQHVFGLFDHVAPATDLLRELNGGSVLQMSTTTLYNIIIFCFQSLQSFNELVHYREQLIFDTGNCCNVHCSGESIVRALRHINMVIGMKQFLAHDLITTICNYFIGIHVGLSTATGLPNNQRKMIVQRTGDHFVASLFDSNFLFFVHLTQIKVCSGRCFFQHTKCLVL